MSTPSNPAAPAVQGDRLRLDYQQTTDLMRQITDARFKLLALVPTLSGAAVAILGRPSSAGELLAVGLLGLVATVGVLLYELRNAQLYDYGLHRAQELERRLELPSLGDGSSGGLFSERPDRSLRLLGVLPVDRDAGLILVYSAALAGWTYLCAWGALRALGLGHTRQAGGAIGVLVGLVLVIELTRVHDAPRPSRSS
jgi:hypothetical protein